MQSDIMIRTSQGYYYFDSAHACSWLDATVFILLLALHGADQLGKFQHACKHLADQESSMPNSAAIVFNVDRCLLIVGVVS